MNKMADRGKRVINKPARFSPYEENPKAVRKKVSLRLLYRNFRLITIKFIIIILLFLFYRTLGL